VKSVSQLSRRFRVAFDDAKTVPNAGLVIPLRLADRLDVTAALNDRVSGTNRRSQPNSGDKAMCLVAMLLAGGEFISDVDVLTSGATLSRLGYRGFSESRLGEWLRSLTGNDLDGFADTLTAVTGVAWAAGLGPDLDAASPADPLIIDLDSTHTETYGVAKEGAQRRNYVGKRGYHPLLAVEASTGQVIAARLRDGTTSSAHGAAAFVADTLARVRHLTGSSTPLLLRADSGFYLRDLIDHCVAADTRFSITVRHYRPIRDLIDTITEPEWRAVNRTATKQIDIAEVPYEIKGTSAKPRPGITCRLIVRRVRTLADTGQPQPRLFDLVDYHAFVTNQPGDPETLRRRHTHRAIIETTIRDLKHGLGLNHYPSGSFTANAAWLHLNTLAHNLARFTNRLITPHTLTTKTLRYRYLTIPGRITTGSRTTTLHLPTNWPWHHHITHALTLITQPTAA
jgi:hypothetical protein